MLVLKSIAIWFVMLFSLSSFAYVKSPTSNSVTFSLNELRVSGLPIVCGWSDAAVCRLLANQMLRRSDWQYWRSEGYSCSVETYNALRLDARTGSIVGKERDTVYNSLTCTPDPSPKIRPNADPGSPI